MAPAINQKVAVQARTEGGYMTPILVTWNQKNYSVTQVRQRRVSVVDDRKVEHITVSVIEVKKMRLEFDHKSKEWILLSIE